MEFSEKQQNLEESRTNRQKIALIKGHITGAASQEQQRKTFVSYHSTILYCHSDLCVPTQCRCSGLVFHLITHTT